MKELAGFQEKIKRVLCTESKTIISVACVQVLLFLRREKARSRVLTGEDGGEGDDILASVLAVLEVEDERLLVSCSTSSSDTLAAGNEGMAASSRISRNLDDVIMNCGMCDMSCDQIAIRRVFCVVATVTLVD